MIFSVRTIFRNEGFTRYSTFIWWVTDDARLSPTARSILADSSNQLFLSAASAWEIVIKVRLEKLILPEAPEQYIPTRLVLNKFESLPIQMIHALRVANLPDYHRDPFDRILIAQSQVENLPIVTVDSQIARYSVSVIW